MKVILGGVAVILGSPRALKLEVLPSSLVLVLPSSLTEASTPQEWMNL